MDPNTDDVVRSLLLDCRAADASEHLRAAGVPSILLKGASIATWLYNDGAVRPYIDVDLLVAPSLFQRAIMLLAECGYDPRLVGADPAELGPKELDLIGPGSICIDLHCGLIGTSRPTEECWEILAGRTASMRLCGGREVQVLDVPARAMHLALHAAQNGPVDAKALTDLERGLAMLARDDWLAAAKLADDLGASEALAAGLRLLPAGRCFADGLGLTHNMSVELRLRTWSAPPEAIFFERLGDVPGFAKKMVLLTRKLFPTPATLRAGSAMARRRPLGLVFAWMVHPVVVAIRFPPALIAWYRARLVTRLR